MSLLLLILMLAACAPEGDLSRPENLDSPLVVSAGSSLMEVMERLALRYERDAGRVVELNLSGSSTLAAQILAGAPVDLFLSADEFQMDRLAAEGLIRIETRINLLSNQLVGVAPIDTAAGVNSLESLLDPAFRRIAVGDPSAVPVGVYTRAYLESVGLWDVFQKRLVPTRSVRAALAMVEVGAVDAGIIYRTDALSSSRVKQIFEVPVGEGPTIIYPAAVTTQATHPQAARRLLAFLQGPGARTIFESAGFIVLDSPP